MNSLSTALQTSHTVSLAAMEEASWFGERTADLEHMLLALTLSEQEAGQVLRGLGITLEATRAAVAAQHREQLAGLGIDAPTPPQQRIVFHETGGYEWSARAGAILSRASGRGKRGDATAILRELLAEPSGLIEAVLRRLDTSPAQIVARLDELDAAAPPATGVPRTEPGGGPSAAPRSPTPARLSHSAAAFVPAPVAAVWSLLAAPSNVPVWDSSVGSVQVPERTPHDPGVTSGVTSELPGPFLARARTERDDGRQLRVAPELIAQRITLARAEPEHLIEWRIAYPDSPGANTKVVRMELEPAAGGTQLRTSLTWERAAAQHRRTLRGFLLRPLTRLAIRLQVSHINAGVSRAFR